MKRDRPNPPGVPRRIPSSATAATIAGGRYDGGRVAVVDPDDQALALIVQLDGEVHLRTRMKPADVVATLRQLADRYEAQL